MAWNVKYGACRVDFWFDFWGDRTQLSTTEVTDCLTKIAALVKEYDPDILFTEEIEVDSKRSAYVDMVQFLLENTNLRYAAYDETWDARYVPSEGVGRINLGNACFEAHDYEAALAHYTAAVERDETLREALNGLGTCLMNLGRLEEARREYARALRLVGRDARPAVHAFIRANLARTLFEGKRYAEAARALDEAARHFATQGAKADELTMRLLGVEALARSGEPGRARAMAGDLAAELRSLGAAEPELLESYEAALKGDLPDVDLLETLRSRTQEQISERLRRAG